MKWSVGIQRSILKREGLQTSGDRVAQLCREKGLTLKLRQNPHWKVVVEGTQST